jgi:hypothetical protein
MTKEDFLKLKKGDLVTLTKTAKTINAFYEYKVGDQLYYDSFYTTTGLLKFQKHASWGENVSGDIYQINLLRKSCNLNGAKLWVMCHFTEDIIDFIETLDVVRNNKLESILN